MIIPNAFGRPYCVYAHMCDGEIVYIGSGTLSRAISMVGNRSIEWQEFVRVNVVDMVIVAWCAKRSEAYAVERILIRTLKPRLNRAGVRPRPHSNNVIRAVRCVETGEIYPSAAEAGRQLGMRGGNVTAIIRGYQHRAKGLTFEYHPSG